MSKAFRALLPATALIALLACSDTQISAPEVAEFEGAEYGVLDPNTDYDLGLQEWDATPLGPAAVVDPSIVMNGSFEQGFAYWTRFNQGSGGVYQQQGTRAPISYYPVEPPPDGTYAAMSDQRGPGVHVWFQEITVPTSRSELHFYLQIANRARYFYTPNTLSHRHYPNQQFRADIMQPGSAPLDVGAGVLANIYHTQPGDPAVTGYQEVIFDLDAFRGETVLIRFAQVDNRGYFQAGVDNVFVDVLDPTNKDECKKGGWEQFGFRNQGQCVRFVETGKDSRN